MVIFMDLNEVIFANCDYKRHFFGFKSEYFDNLSIMPFQLFHDLSRNKIKNFQATSRIPENESFLIEIESKSSYLCISLLLMITISSFNAAVQC